MNATELIASGLLEAHVLGQTSASEAALVEMMRRESAEVRAELDAIELALENVALVNAVKPSAHTRAAVLAAVEHSNEGRVVPMKPAPSSQTSSVKWLAAASLGALLLSAAGNWLLYRKVSTMEERLAVLQNERSVLAEQFDVQRASLDASNAQLAVVLDPHKKMVVLGGVGAALDGRARLFWDEATHDVYLDILSLPAPPAGKQYQLWALADGQPIDAGMFDSNDSAAQVQRMKPVTNAQAFAVTLENAGGVPSPTLTAMVLLGQV